MNAPTRDLKAKIWERDAQDFYIEPIWCSRALFSVERFEGSVSDPACGIGRIVESAWVANLIASGSDIVDRTDGTKHWFNGVADFRNRNWRDADNFVSNPPFSIADEFARLALDRAIRKVAMLLPATWHFGAKRAGWLKTTPLRRIYALTPRPSMPPGAVILSGVEPGGGTKDFSWYVWLRGYDGPVEMCWLNRDDQHGVSP